MTAPISYIDIYNNSELKNRPSYDRISDKIYLNWLRDMQVQKWKQSQILTQKVPKSNPKSSGLTERINEGFFNEQMH